MPYLKHLLAFISVVSVAAGLFYLCVYGLSSLISLSTAHDVVYQVICDNGVSGVTRNSRSIDHYVLVVRPDGIKVWTNATCIIEEL